MSSIRRLVIMVALSGSVALGTAFIAADDASAPPDLSGVWQVAGPYVTGSANVRTVEGQPVPMSRAAEAEFKYLQAKDAQGKVSIHNTQMGWPKGFIQASRGPFDFEIFQEQKQISFFFEEDHQYFMAYFGAKHPANVKPSFLGDSIAHWEGDTLVIDTIGFNGETPLNDYQVSDKLHTVMRLQLIDGGKSLENIVTIEDPIAFTRTWQMKMVYNRRPRGERLQESVYAENNRDLPDLNDQ